MVVKKRIIRKKVVQKVQSKEEEKRSAREKALLAKKNDPLVQSRPKNFGIGRDVQPKRDLTRFVRWPRYIRLQRQRAVLYKRLKIPPHINQFRSGTLDRQTATQLFRLLDKYRPESKKQKTDRLRSIAQKKADGKEVTPAKRPPVVQYGVNKVTTSIEKKRASLVVIAADVDPIEIVLHLPTLCRKMGIPYCIVRGGRARLGRVCHKKTVSTLTIENVNPEDKAALNKLSEVIKTNFNDRQDAVRKQWGSRVLSKKSRVKIARYQQIRARELQAKQDQLASGGGSSTPNAPQAAAAATTEEPAAVEA
jgi:large subunit ribosomal protein L7Ae